LGDAESNSAFTKDEENAADILGLVDELALVIARLNDRVNSQLFWGRVRSRLVNRHLRHNWSEAVQAYCLHHQTIDREIEVSILCPLKLVR